jgi:hypothetical protein
MDADVKAVNAAPFDVSVESANGTFILQLIAVWLKTSGALMRVGIECRACGRFASDRTLPLNPPCGPHALARLLLPRRVLTKEYYPYASNAAGSD